MKLLIFILIVVGCVLVGRMEAAELPPIPGLDQIAIGLDIVTGERKIHVADLSGNTSSKFSVGGTEYGVPVGVGLVPVLKAGVGSEIFTSAYEYTEFRANDVGASLSIPIHKISAVLSLSAASQQVRQTLEMGTNTLVYLREFASLYGLQMLDWTLSSNFVKALSLLPSSYNEQQYEEFLDYFGTHVITAGTYGGLAEASAYMSWQYVEDYGANAAMLNAKLQFSLLKKGVGAGYNRNNITTAFLQSGGKLLNYNLVGGEESLPLSSWAQWVQSVQNRPVQVSYSVVPLIAFIDDLQKRQNVAYLIEQYLSQNQQSNATMDLPDMRIGGCNCHWSPNLASCDSGQTIGAGEEKGYPYNKPYCCDMCISFSALQTFTAPPSEKHRRREAIVGRKKNAVENKEQLRKKKTTSSLPILPGMNQLGVGFDAVRGELLSVPIVELSYKQQLQWYYPSLEQWFLYPDQALDAPLEPNDRTQTLTNLARSASEVAFHEALRSGFTVNLPGLFGLSPHARSSVHCFQAAQSLVASQSELTARYEVTIVPPTFLNKTAPFVKAVSLLPSSIDGDDWSAYALFVQTFGTHVVASGTYGGKSVLAARVDANYYSSFSDSDISQSLNLLFAGFKSDNVWAASNAAFNAASFSEFQLVGGDFQQVNLLSASSYTEWVNSTAPFPAQVSRAVVSLDTLLPTNSSQAALLHQYIYEIYMPAYQLPNATIVSQWKATMVAEQSSSDSNVTPPNPSYPICQYTKTHDTIWTSYQYWIGPNSIQQYALPLSNASSSTPANIYAKQVDASTSNSECPPNMFVGGFTGSVDHSHGYYYPRYPMTCWYLYVANSNN